MGRRGALSDSVLAVEAVVLLVVGVVVVVEEQRNGACERGPGVITLLTTNHQHETPIFFVFCLFAFLLNPVLTRECCTDKNRC